MPRYIDADELLKVKFHPLPYTHIVPSDLKGLQTDAYERGWNDAIDAIVENAETADVVERKRGKWIRESPYAWMWTCSCCKMDDAYAYSAGESFEPVLQDLFCPNCGAEMKGEE